ncbi:MAG: hypothetical protein L3J35_00035 [Bacteroidales bacterium]|nr:hypothetical protein [Bacteroidales bacterium]
MIILRMCNEAVKELAMKLQCDLKRGYIEPLKEPTTDISTSSIIGCIEVANKNIKKQERNLQQVNL